MLVAERALTEHGRRMVQIDRQLATIERDMAVINQHCTASDDEFQQAMQRYRREYCEAFGRAMGLAMVRKQADATLRRKEK